MMIESKVTNIHCRVASLEHDSQMHLCVTWVKSEDNGYNFFLQEDFDYSSPRKPELRVLHK